MNQNRKQIFTEVLSLDAWHEPFKVDGNTSSVFVELSFKEGRIGGDDSDFPFTFRIALKRALVTLKVEAPLHVDRRSVARSIPDSQAELTRLKTAKETAESQLSGGVKLSPESIAATLSASGKKTSEVTNEERIQIIQTLPHTLVTPIPVDQTSYCWELQPLHNPVLSGQPWHPLDAPRLAVKGGDRVGRLEPGIKITISCALDDIEISDIQYKTQPALLSVDRVLPRNNVAVAIQHLKRVLIDADLEPGALDNRFSEVLVGLVMAVEE